MRRPLVTVIAALLGLGLPASAPARTVVQLPLGSQFNGMAVAPGGQVWVSGEGRRTGRWGRVVGRRVQWRASAALPGFLGDLAPRAGGGAWLLADRRTVVRIDGAGTVGAFGSLTVPFGDQYPDVVVATTDDDRFVLAGADGGLMRVAPDGRAEPVQATLPAPPQRRECQYTDMASAQGGAVVLADYRCWRLLTVSPSGTTSAVDLRPEHGRRYPGAVLVGRDGTLWFTAVTLRGTYVRSVIGHVARDGAIRQFRAPNARLGPRAFAQAPDGSVWAGIDGACAVYRVHRGRVDRIPTPFPVRDIQFAADGRAWLLGHTRLARTTATRLAAGMRARRCDTRRPRMTFPKVKQDYPYAITLRRLRRSGLRVRSSERATLRGEVLIGDARVYVNEVIRHAGQTAVLRLPDEVLDHAAAELRAGQSVALYMNAELRDRSGNGVVNVAPFALRR